MRNYLVLAVAMLPQAAAAEPILSCGFDGNRTKVVIVNSDDAEKRCNYACSYNTITEGGSIELSGTNHKIEAGGTYTYEARHEQEIESVRDSLLKCE